MSDDVQTPWEGRFLSVKIEGKWEYAERKGQVHAAVIVAIDGDDVILVEQFRVPFHAKTIELPAGLVGDDHAGEAIEAAAARELEEETGYRPETVRRLGRFAASPGMSSESFTLVRALGLTRTGEGGGVPGEDITVHRVPLAAVPSFIEEKRTQGYEIDAKLLVLLGGGLVQM